VNVVFLDRDGVINRLVKRDGGWHSPLIYGDFSLLDGVETAIRSLAESNFRVVVVTNQPEISRGRLPIVELEKMHHDLLKLSIEAVLYCPHDSSHLCNCRKPRTGLMLEFLSRQVEPPSHSWMVGDRSSDLIAGRRVGCRTIWISTGQQVLPPPLELMDFEASSLLSATAIIQARTSAQT